MRRIQLCVPDEWYRRSKFRNVPLSFNGSEEDALAQLAEIEKEEAKFLDNDDADEEGTAKLGTAKVVQPSSPPSRQSLGSNTEARLTPSQNRLSSLFGSWRGTPPTSPERDSKSVNADRKSVSEPILLERGKGPSLRKPSLTEMEINDPSPTDTDIEEMLVRLFLFYKWFDSNFFGHFRMILASRVTSVRLCVNYLLNRSGIFFAKIKNPA
jgi:diaphanous 1